MKVDNNLKILGVIILMIGGTIFWLTRPAQPVVQETTEILEPSNTATQSAELAGLLNGNAPWEANMSTLKERLEQIGLPALPQEELTMHTHQHLELWIEGKQVVVPDGIGINEKEGFISILHSHDEAGIIHVESPVVTGFYLGQFFDVWGLKFDDNCIGGYCGGDEKKLKVFVNGNMVESGFREIKLEDLQQIAVVFGTIEQEPKEIPSSFDFPAEYR